METYRIDFTIRGDSYIDRRIPIIVKANSESSALVLAEDILAKRLKDKKDYSIVRQSIIVYTDFAK